MSLCTGVESQRSVTRSFGVFLDLRLYQQLSKQWRRRWFETPSRSLWRQCNDLFLCSSYSPFVTESCLLFELLHIYVGHVIMCILCFAFSWYYFRIWFWASESIAVSLTLKPPHDWHNDTCWWSSSWSGQERQFWRVCRSFVFSFCKPNVANVDQRIPTIAYDIPSVLTQN